MDKIRNVKLSLISGAVFAVALVVLLGILLVADNRSANNSSTDDSDVAQNELQTNANELESATTISNVPADRVITSDDQAEFANGFTVPDGEIWEFDPGQDVAIETDASVEVLGVLRMQPDSSDINHLIRFINIDESQFKGGCLLPDYPSEGCGRRPDTDVGLWVGGAGRLDANGSPKTSWSRLAGSASAGNSTITLEAEPSGWQVGDEISVVPTESPAVDGFSEHFDLRTIASVDGATVTLNEPLSYNHPELANPGPDGGTFRAEVLNLSRNVRIEGQDNTHRAHVHFGSTSGQAISNVAIRYMGPHYTPDHEYEANNFVLGRYGLHFHMNSRKVHTEVSDKGLPRYVVDEEKDWPGAIVDGVVVRDTDSHAFVVHESDNVTLRGTIAYNTSEEAYWWDCRCFRDKRPDAPGGGSTAHKIPPAHITNNLVYDRTVAAKIRKRQSGTSDANYRGAGYYLGAGVNMTVKNSVAVGVEGGVQASGFTWPEDASGEWTFNEGNISHNNHNDGIFGWQNDTLKHHLNNVVVYHNGNAGVEHGAYTNTYQYRNLTILGNADAGFEFHAITNPKDPMHLADTIIDGLGLPGTHGITFEKHTVPASHATIIDNVHITGVTNKFTTRSNVDTSGAGPDWYDIINVNVTSDDFNVINPNQYGTRIRVQPISGTPFEFTDETYTPVTIAAFSDNEPGERGARGPWLIPDVSPQNLAIPGGTSDPVPPVSDTENPTTPGNLQASIVDGNDASLSWSASTDNVSVEAYEVIRNGLVIATPTSTSYVDDNLAADTYIYQVRAVDPTGNVSSLSDGAEITIEEDDIPVTDTQAPTVPGNLRTVSVQAESVELAWDASEDNVGVSEYIVRRNGIVVAITETPGYTDTSVTPGRDYSYEVLAVDEAGNTSNRSNVIEVTIPMSTGGDDSGAPSQPQNLRATRTSSRQINLRWDTSTDNEGISRYEIYRNGRLIGRTRSTQFGDGRVRSNTTYEYYVVAVDTSGNQSDPSQTLSVTTPSGGGRRR